MTKSYENRKSLTNSKRPESISNVLSSAVKNSFCTVDDPPVCPTTQKWHLWSFSCHQNHFKYLPHCHSILFFVQSTSSAMASAMTSWKLLVPLTANTRFLVLWCKKTANLQKTDENRHHFSFQTQTWENRRPWDLPQHRPWLGLLQRHQGSYRALHSPGWMMIHFFAELVKGGEGDGPNKSETLSWPKMLYGWRRTQFMNHSHLL